MLASIAVENLRCIRDAKLEFDPRATVIVGANASGKTCLLEAIFLLSHGRSFRTSIRSELISSGASVLRIIGSTQDVPGHGVVGLELAGDETKLRLGGHPAAAWQVAKTLPVQIIDPSIHRIVEEGSARRRRLVDWGVFHVKPHFLEHWRTYQRVLAHRNALLRTGAANSVLRVWTDALVASAPLVHEDRVTYLASLAPRFEALASELTGEPVSLSYKQGWAIDRSFSDALQESKAREERQQTTVVGPHRSDIVIEVDATLARKRLSRGQQKLLAAALILAQIELRAELDATQACLLLDDPAAELDVDNLGKFLAAVQRMPAQIILTSLDPKSYAQLSLTTMFHVERGEFRRVL